MASVDKSSDASNVDDNRAPDATSSCLNDPNYAIICVFLQKFGGQLKIEHPDFVRLQKMIENTDEVHDELRQFFVRLLRKTRKSVQPDKLDSALAKFCYTYSAQDAWEVERFGYKRASLAVKLRILKEVLESQFDKNPNFRSLITAQTATELRSQPLGKDKLGNAYWSTIDGQCNLRIYQEHLDEEIWKVVATNRDEMVKLISCLRGNELVMPSLVGLIDEDSSSNSMPPKVDALQNENGTSNGNGTANGNDGDDKNVPCLKIKLNGGDSTVEQISNGDNTNGAKNPPPKDSANENDEDEEDASAASEIDELSQAASESSTVGTKSNETQGSKRISLLASKPPRNKLKLRIFASDKKVLKRNLEADADTATGKSKRPTLKKAEEYEDSEFGSEELSDEELDENEMSDEDDDDDEVGPAIEEPTMYVQGSGSGVANKCENILWPECDDLDEDFVSEAIEEDVFYVYGEGNGKDCDVGNNDIKTTEPPASSVTESTQPVVQSKPMFFFGQAGCLKLSPMKTTAASENSAESTSNNTENIAGEMVESEKLENEKTECEKIPSKTSDESSSVVNETIINDTNSVALEANSVAVGGNVTSNDETDRGISVVNESLDVPSNSVDVKLQENTSSSNRQINEIETKPIETNELSVEVKVEPSVSTNVNVSESEIKSEDPVTAENINAISSHSKDNIESNSSVALESISVQENNELIQDESLPNESEPLPSDSHLTNDSIKESGKCDETESITCEVKQNIDNQSEEKKPCENSEIVNEDELKSLSSENQSSLSQDAQNINVERINDATVGVDDVPIENQTLDSSKIDENIEADEQSDQAAELKVKDTSVESSASNAIENTVEDSNEPEYAGQEPVVEEIIVPKKAYICGPSDEQTNVADVSTETPQIEEQIKHHTEQEIEKESSSALDDNKSNIEEKTESPIEQIVTNTNTFEPNTLDSLKADTTEAEAIQPEESEISQISPTETNIEPSFQIEKEPETETPKIVPPNEDIGVSVAEPVKEQGFDVEPEADLAPAKNVVVEPVAIEAESIEPEPSEPSTAEPVIEPVENKIEEPLPSTTIGKLEQPDLEPSSIVSEPEKPVEEKDIPFTAQTVSEPKVTEPIETQPVVTKPITMESIELKSTEPQAIELDLVSDELEKGQIIANEKPDTIESIGHANEIAERSTENIEIDIKKTNEIDEKLIASEEKIHSPKAIKSTVQEAQEIAQPTISAAALVTEKRKSIEDVEKPSESKKLCEENITIDVQHPPKTELIVNAEKEPINESIFLKTPYDISIQSSKIENKSAEDQLNKFETSKAVESIENIGKEKYESKTEQTTTVEVCQQSSTIEKIEVSQPVEKKQLILPEPSASDDVNESKQNANEKEPLPIASESETPEEIPILKKVEAKFESKALKNEKSVEKPKVETTTIQNQPSDAPRSTRKKPVASTPVVETSRGIQLRNRKRRISTEKARHSSESDDNAEALIDSPVSQASSDEEVGGKRIKMRPKVVKRTVRKSVEQKRNIKDTDWSSDEKEKPNAKRATSALPKEDIEEPTPKKDDIKPAVKEESLETDPLKLTEVPSVADAEVKEEEQQSDEEKATPTRRAGRPARRGRKPGPKPKAKRVNEVKAEEIKAEKPKPESNEQIESAKEEKAETVPTQTPPKPETRRKKRSLLGLDIADVETIQASAETDAPVRQSRRIAQIKIKEEAERRKAEEVALQKMKEASEKKKKGGFTKEPSASEEENSESEAKLEKKKRRKKGNKDKPWQTDSEVDSSERDEEDVYEHEDVERLPPLRSDHEFSPESDIEDESQIVPTKRARTARKDKTERREESSEEEEDIHACQKCSKSDHPEWILLCDKCDKGYHCSCLIPVLFVIPEGNWFCPPCQQEKLIDELEAKLIVYDNMVQQKEQEEAQRQRLLLTTISEANVIQDSKRDRQRARAADFDGSGASDDDHSSDESSSDGSETKEKKPHHDRRTRARPTRQRNITESSENSSSDNTSDNEPIYKLRKRRQANVSYRFNEYDELINRAIKSEMDEVAGAGNLGRGKDISTIMEADKEEKRLKKLEQQQKERELAGETVEQKDDDSDDQPLKIKEPNSDGSDSEPIRPKAIKRAKNLGRKKKKLNSLDDDSDEDADSSDDDFKGDDSSDEEEEEEDESTPDSESSLDSIVKKRRKGRGLTTRRSNRERKKRYDADFIDDSSFDDEDNVPLVKKKKKVESDFSDFDGSSEELEEDVDSEDLCDDSTDDSDRSWGKRKSKKSAPKGKEIKPRKKKPDGERAFKGKVAKKKSKLSDDDDDDDSDDENGDEVLPKSRRTRGKKLPYLLDDDFDSSDDGIKPGVKRPDTPPEERAAFIKKQEEIKRMLAEKRDESLDKIPPPIKGSLSTIPAQIIQTAKALDVDLKKTAILNKTASDNDSNGFDDDLPEDFDPEDMDEDAIAKMMEEEEFAQQQLKLAGETIRNRKLKDALTEPIIKRDESPTKLSIETAPSVIMPPNVPPSLVSPLPITTQLTIPDIPPSMYTAQFQGAHSKMPTTPKKRGRKIKDDIPLVIGKGPTIPVLPPQVQPQPLPQSQPPQQVQTLTLPPSQPRPQPPISSIQISSIVPPNKPNTLLNIPSVLQQTPVSQLFSPSTIQHTSSVIAHSSVIQQQQRRLPPMSTVTSLLGLNQNREQIIPSTVLDVQNTRLLDPSELGKPPDELLDAAAKKRARRKKITPTRDSLITSPPNVTVTPGASQPTPVTIPNVPNVSKPITSILSERLSANPVEKPGLSIATPPQLYSPSSRSQASVITRLSRPSQRQPFPTGQSQPQRYYAPNSSGPPHSIPSTGSHSRPYHAPNVTVASGPRPPPLVPPPHTSGHLPHPMYMRGQPGIYGSYPNIQPPPMHRSLQSIEHSSNSPQNFTGPYQNIPFGSYYAAAAAAERRSGAIIGTFEPFDNKNPSSHDRLPAYAHPSLGLAALAGRNPAAVASGSPGGDDERAPPPGGGGSTSEFSGLVSYFSSQQDDLDQ